jgi:hypothetical protein
MGRDDIKTTMIYVDLAKPHIMEQVAKLDRIQLSPPLLGAGRLTTSIGTRKGLPRSFRDKAFRQFQVSDESKPSS